MEKNYIIDRRAYMDRRMNAARRDCSRLDSDDDERRDRGDRRNIEDEPNTYVFDTEDELHNYVQTIPNLEDKDFSISMDERGFLYKLTEKSKEV